MGGRAARATVQRQKLLVKRNTEQQCNAQCSTTGTVTRQHDAGRNAQADSVLIRLRFAAARATLDANARRKCRHRQTDGAAEQRREKRVGEAEG